MKPAKSSLFLLALLSFAITGCDKETECEALPTIKLSYDSLNDWDCSSSATISINGSEMATIAPNSELTITVAEGLLDIVFDAGGEDVDDPCPLINKTLDAECGVAYEAVVLNTSPPDGNFQWQFAFL